MPGPAHIFDRELLARRRQRAAAHAGRYDFLLRRVAEDLAERLSGIKRTFPIALDLGTHHGLVGHAIAASPRVGQMIYMDRVDAGLRRLDGFRVQADEDLLPFKPATIDLVVSGLALQFIDDLPGTLTQIRHILKPDGLLLASLLGGSTLQELRRAMLQAETETAEGASPRVTPFADVRDLGTLLQRAGLALPVVDSDTVTATYGSPLALMRDLRGMGASNMLRDRSRRPLMRRTLQRAVEIYAEEFSNADGRVEATFEIITLTAWAPHDSQQKPLAPGSGKMSLAAALGKSPGR
jgi:NADH dehydrogenase [ubiquinone] 1 alpha subcomplex assembly factor 5